MLQAPRRLEVFVELGGELASSSASFAMYMRRAPLDFRVTVVERLSVGDDGLSERDGTDARGQVMFLFEVNENVGISSSSIA